MVGHALSTAGGNAPAGPVGVITEGALTDEAGWPAPAKLNLFLHVTGRRADGYHELQTVFQFLDFGDTLFFDIRDDGQITRLHGPAGVAEADDLTVRAARALQVATGCTRGVDIRLDKRIPLGAGLGGGSSDAATTLVALNALWRLGLGVDPLAAIGLRLGADVPVFVHGHAAWAEGVGERLAPIDLPEPWYLVVTPDVHVDTGSVFRDPALPRDTPRIGRDAFLAGSTRNDCERVVRARHPEIARTLDALCAYGHARLSGTGASVFCAFPTREDALRVRGHFAGQRAVVARGCNRSALPGRATGVDARPGVTAPHPSL